MLSKRKMAEATMTWIREQLEDAQSRGMSLKDDTDGIAVRVERVRQSGTLISLDISANSEAGSNELEYCLLLQQKIPVDVPGVQPTAEDLAVIDDTP